MFHLPVVFENNVHFSKTFELLTIIWLVTFKYLQNKNEGNENKIMLGDLNCTMDKIGNFNNSLSCKPDVSAATRTFHFLLKTEK